MAHETLDRTAKLNARALDEGRTAMATRARLYFDVVDTTGGDLVWREGGERVPNMRQSDGVLWVNWNGRRHQLHPNGHGGMRIHRNEPMGSGREGSGTPTTVCEVCRQSFATRARCTNGRCPECHGKWCTPGGVTGPGHGRRWPEGR